MTFIASSRGHRPSVIAHHLGCATQTVRNALHAFERQGLVCLIQESSRPKTVESIFDEQRREALRTILHQDPRSYGKATSVWTLSLAAQVCQESHLTKQRVSIETIRQALKRLGMGWLRAKNWITSPDPDYARKKHRRDTLMALAERCGWAVGFEDEVWWSRVAQPSLHTWREVKQPLRLLERSVSKADPDPKALGCYGLLDAYSGTLRLRFVQGRPVSQVTTDFLEWLCHQLAEAGQRKLVLVWDNASWHVSKQVRNWIGHHNQQALQAQRAGKPGIQLIPCWLPTKSPWLNRIEPHWIHGKRAIVEPARLLTAEALMQRVYDHFGCEQVEPLMQQIA